MLFDFFDFFYEKLNESIAIINEQGEVEYCNDSFALLVDISVVRFRNRKVNIASCIESVNDVPLTLDFIKKQQLAINAL